jgi:hypothetical protein
VRSWVRFQFQEEYAENKVAMCSFFISLILNCDAMHSACILVKAEYKDIDFFSLAAEKGCAIRSNPSRGYPACAGKKRTQRAFLSGGLSVLMDSNSHQNDQILFLIMMIILFEIDCVQHSSHFSGIQQCRAKLGSVQRYCHH